MKSSSQTTYILLERGSEDRALWEELHKIIAALRTESCKTFIKKYPLIWELKHNLKIELDKQDAI